MVGLQWATIILPSDVKSESLVKRTENCKIFVSLMSKELEHLDDHGGYKIRDPVDEEFWICMIHSFKPKTKRYCAECKAKVLANRTMQHLKLYFVFFLVLCNVLSVST